MTTLAPPRDGAAPSRPTPTEEPAATSGPLRPSGTTVIPRRDGVRPAERRPLHTVTASDVFDLVGSIAGGIALATLLFTWFAPLTGAVGWFVVAFLGFLLIYTTLVSFTATREEVLDRIVTVLLGSAGTILIGALAFVVAFTLVRGSEALPHLGFLFETMEFAGPLDPLDTGGVAHAIVGTLIQISIALAITIPLGVTTAVFLNEVGGRFARFVRTISDAMTALPSIVAGLFVYAAVITFVTGQRSGFAASIAITVMMLPIVIRASDVVLRLVPGNLREAAYALGTSRWRTVWHVVLPTSRSGLVTAVILGTARGIGETSPVLLTSGVTQVMNLDPFNGPMISLPLAVFTFVKSPEPSMVARGFGTAAVLILLVLTLFMVARAIGGRGPGQLSDRQRRRAVTASRDDVARMTIARGARRAATDRATATPPATSHTTPRTEDLP